MLTSTWSTTSSETSGERNKRGSMVGDSQRDLQYHPGHRPGRHWCAGSPRRSETARELISWLWERLITTGGRTLVEMFRVCSQGFPSFAPTHIEGIHGQAGITYRQISGTPTVGVTPYRMVSRGLVLGICSGCRADRS